MKGKSQGARARRKWFALPAHVYVGYLLVGTLLFTGASFARYVYRTSAGDGARTAAFVVSASAVSPWTDGTIVPNGQNTYTFQVSNSRGGSVSQVAVSYGVTVTLSQPLPQGVTLLLDGETGVVSGSSYVFRNAGVFQAGTSSTHSHTLAFQAGAGMDQSQPMELHVSVSVDAEQID